MEEETTRMWDQQFEDILRRALPYMEPGETILADLELRDYGLDSLGIVDLLMDLESTYGVQFRDESLSRETFATPAGLWATLSSLTGAGPLPAA
ncbi:acyl carrier protein [Streptomyces eurocidicus]|nr:acyl carrier protein [Streptomyces eurocidicus]MBB5119025.1 acyl carrier protein [Streptomyces eurocidicus]